MSFEQVAFYRGAVVTAEGSFRADVLVEDEKIVAVGADLPTNGAETVDATALFPGADADIMLWDQELQITASMENRHGNVDYTPREGMTFHRGPASVYVRGNLVHTGGEVVGEGGSGRFIERNFAAPGLEEGA